MQHRRHRRVIKRRRNVQHTIRDQLVGDAADHLHRDLANPAVEILVAVPADHFEHLRIAFENFAQALVPLLANHVDKANAGLHWWMVNRHQRGLIGFCQRFFQPLEPARTEERQLAVVEMAVQHQGAEIRALDCILVMRLLRREHRRVTKTLAQGLGVVVVARHQVNRHLQRCNQVPEVGIGHRPRVLHQVAGDQHQVRSRAH